ncbi:uncharacterized protein EAE97_011366 [Botrytis byssoidea]|uniref:Uncharacterized protein n=1 Tax=Botrytis byssoidea TaxID=139641 RepID=A0A9P5HRN4_9HELO|nr:uncharacterized protein EAE97_011366 [Botrytis byssoidea]KAF7921098.1 hypothetical protein EAE97_011366 [Botrytis byssoidea]
MLHSESEYNASHHIDTNQGNLASLLSGRVAIDAGDSSGIDSPMTDKCDGRFCICGEATCLQRCQSGPKDGPKDDAISSNTDWSDEDVFAASF